MIRDFISKIRLTLALAPHKIPLLIIILAASLGVVWQVYSLVKALNEIPSISCEVLKEDIIRKLSPFQHCNQTSDCHYNLLSCPFQCVALATKEITPEITNLIASYHQQCGYCIENCEQNTPPICITNQCIGDKGDTK